MRPLGGACSGTLGLWVIVSSPKQKGRLIFRRAMGLGSSGSVSGVMQVFVSTGVWCVFCVLVHVGVRE